MTRRHTSFTCPVLRAHRSLIRVTQIYEKRATEALVEALRSLLDMRPQARILLSNALRFPDVFETFRRGCGEWMVLLPMLA